MGNEHAESSDWRTRRKCSKLSPKQSDEIFFPKPGGKSKRAKLFCSTCPVQKQCLDNAILNNEMGMWAGTTEGERRRMAGFLGLVAAELDNFLPPEPTRKDRVLRPIRKDANILGDPLFGVEGPDEAELERLRLYGM